MGWHFSSGLGIYAHVSGVRLDSIFRHDSEFLIQSGPKTLYSHIELELCET
jgi:hypothetical protein